MTTVAGATCSVRGWRHLDPLNLTRTFRLKGPSWTEGGVVLPFGGAATHTATSTNLPPRLFWKFGIKDLGIRSPDEQSQKSFILESEILI